VFFFENSNSSIFSMPSRAMALHAHLLHLVMILSLVNSVRVRETAQHKISTEVAILTNVPKGFPPILVQMYSDVSFVAEGGFGKVFKGTLKSTGLVHAIKVPKNAMNLEHKCGVIEQIHAMVRQQSGPTFTHIMNCLGSSNTDKYMILEWSGVDGYEAIVSCSFNKAMGLFKQLLIGLVSLHRSNPFPVIVHHDLKWQNVGVDEKNCLRIIDLEDTLPGVWGKRINGAQGYTFSTPETANNKFGFFCGLQPSRSYSPDKYALCPFAWTFDAYTAGIMAIQLFGVDFFFYLKMFRSMGESHLRESHLRDHLARSSVLDIPSIMVKLSLDQFMQGQDKTFVQDLQSSDIDTMYLEAQEALAAQYRLSRKNGIDSGKKAQGVR